MVPGKVSKHRESADGRASLEDVQGRCAGRDMYAYVLGHGRRYGCDVLDEEDKVRHE